MIDTNYIVILLIILFLLGIVVWTICYNKKNNRRMSEQFESSIGDSDNLILGGSLLSTSLPPNSMLVPNNIDLIRPFPNPSSSTNVVEILPSSRGIRGTRGDIINHMKFKLDTAKNMKYNITMWVGNINIKNTLNGIVDFSQSQTPHKKCVNLYYKKLRTVTKLYDGKDIIWTYLNIIITTQNVNMFLGYNKENKEPIYFADITMTRLFNLASDFKATGGLQCMIMPSKTVDNKTTILPDLTDTANVFKSNEQLDISNGSVNILGKTITGTRSNKLNTKQCSNIKELTIVLTIDILEKSNKQLNSGDSILTEETESLNEDSELLRISGNQDTAIAILLRFDETNNQYYLVFKLSGDIIGSPIHLPRTKLTHHIIYNIDAPDDSKFVYYLNNSETPSLTSPTKKGITIPRLYLDSNPIVINNDKNNSNNVNFYSLLIYNTALDHKKRTAVYDYVSTAHNTQTSDIESYTFQKCTDGVLPNNPSSRKKYNDNSTPDTGDINSNKVPVLTGGNGGNNGGNGENNGGNGNNGENNGGNDGKGSNNGTHDDCPSVYKHNNKHMVRVSHNTKYGKQYNLNKNNRYLVRNYGSNKTDARDTYSQNYPECPIPPTLQEHQSNSDHENSPFSLDKSPYTNPSCYNVKWNMVNPKKMSNMSDKCKRVVSTHCENNPKDTGCFDWHPENYDSPESQTNRRYFQPADPRCHIGNHEIEDHPDYKKFIRKDKIPCWNCKLD